jgi:hypothetical protein
MGSVLGFFSSHLNGTPHPRYRINCGTVQTVLLGDVRSRGPARLASFIRGELQYCMSLFMFFRARTSVSSSTFVECSDKEGGRRISKKEEWEMES